MAAFHSIARASRGLLICACAAALAGCATSDDMSMGGAAPMGQPGVAFSGARVDAQNQAILDAVTALGYRPVETLSPQDARNQPTAADGVKEVLRKQGKPTTPPQGVTTRDMSYAGAAGPLPARVYKPDGASGSLPVIAYFHGGGWVLADINVYDSSARALAREAKAIVVSFEYRHAPEFKFPAQHDDAVAAYRWLIANAASLGGDPARIAVAGESAGGNLAANVAIAARDMGLQAPVHQLLVYPVAGNDMNTPSYQENANAKPLNRAMMMWFAHHTGRSPADLADPRINLVAANVAGVAPATVILAQVDPLRSDGEMYAAHLKAAGVPVETRLFSGATHEFFGTDAVYAKAGAAQAYAGERLRAAFGGR